MGNVRESTTPDVDESSAIGMALVDDVTSWPCRACCCPAAPMVKVLLPTVRRDRVHLVDLYLCGHHYRESFGTLLESGATTIARLGSPVMG